MAEVEGWGQSLQIFRECLGSVGPRKFWILSKVLEHLFKGHFWERELSFSLSHVLDRKQTVLSCCFTLLLFTSPESSPATAATVASTDKPVPKKYTKKDKGMNPSNQSLPDLSGPPPHLSVSVNMILAQRFRQMFWPFESDAMFMLD